jgi:NADPH:quinone reductase-like Zn-dependent oxidoreductase
MDVLSLSEVPEPRPGPGEVLVRVEARPVHPSDLSFLRGAYRVRPKLPQIAGLSGAGTIGSVGEGISLALGARVAFRWPGAWAELVAVPVERVYLAPEDASIDDAAQLPVNPMTAWGLLQVAEAKAPAAIGLTAPRSSVAKIVAVLAAERGLRTIDLAPVPEELPALAERVRVATGGEGLAALLDCVGGPIVTHLFPALRPGATVVAYGVSSREPASVTNATLVYSNLTWRGFGIDRWCSPPSGPRSASAASRSPSARACRSPRFREGSRRSRPGRRARCSSSEGSSAGWCATCPGQRPLVERGREG